MKRCFAIMVLLLTIFMTSCMNVREVSKIGSSNDIISEDDGDLLIKKLPLRPKIVIEENKDNLDIPKDSENLDKPDKPDKPIGANSVRPPDPPPKPSYSKKTVVLTYHHISNNPFSGITITPERFEEDLKMLRDNNFNVISLREMISGIEGNVEFPKNAVVITFDDGIGSFYKYAYPLLKKYTMPAVEFIITARNESYVSSDNELNPLSPEEINEMFLSGLVDIQSHTHNSHDYIYRNAELKKGPKLTYKIYNIETNTLESDEEYIARITEDLTVSREIIYKYTGVYPDMLSFPFGSYNKKVWDVGKAVGFNYFITTQPDYNKENSKSQTIYRIRSGDAALTSDKLLKSIIDCVNN